MQATPPNFSQIRQTLKTYYIPTLTYFGGIIRKSPSTGFHARNNSPLFKKTNRRFCINQVEPFKTLCHIRKNIMLLSKKITPSTLWSSTAAAERAINTFSTKAINPLSLRRRRKKYFMCLTVDRCSLLIYPKYFEL